VAAAYLKRPFTLSRLPFFVFLRSIIFTEPRSSFTTKECVRGCVGKGVDSALKTDCFYSAPPNPALSLYISIYQISSSVCSLCCILLFCCLFGD
jgi:hypothetical protein